MDRIKLITFYVEKKYLWGARLVMFLAASPFLMDLYQGLMTGVVQDGRIIATYEDGRTFNLMLGKKVLFAMFFIWLGTGGLVEKDGATKDEEK